MANAPLHVSLCSPTHPPVDFEASEVVLPGAAGIFTVLPGHTPVLTTLTTGSLIAYGTHNEDLFFALHNGFAEILDNRITILADTLEHADEIDHARAEAAQERARARLAKHEEDIDTVRSRAAHARSLARLQAYGREEY